MLKTLLKSQLGPMNTWSRFPNGQCVVERRTGWEVGEENDLSSLGWGCALHGKSKGLTESLLFSLLNNLEEEGIGFSHMAFLLQFKLPDHTCQEYFDKAMSTLPGKQAMMKVQAWEGQMASFNVNLPSLS